MSYHLTKHLFSFKVHHAGPLGPLGGPILARGTYVDLQCIALSLNPDNVMKKQTSVIITETVSTDCL